MKKKIYMVLLLLLMAAGIYYVGKMGIQMKDSSSHEGFLSKKQKESLQLWYTDESLSDYLNSLTVAYSEANDIRVEAILKTDKELVEAVYQASRDPEQETPEVYLLTNDMLEKAYLAGVADPVPDSTYVNQDQFAQGALHAVTYKDKQVAYPFYYETSVLLYNKTYLEDYAVKKMQAQLDLEAAEEAQSAADAGDVEEEAETASEEEVAKNFTQEEIDDCVAQLLPTTIDQLELLADEYDAPEQVEGVFKWDVSDILYNYNYAGNYMIIGGDDGDDLEKVDIYNLETLQCLTMFQNLNQFFSIEVSNANYDSVMQEFIDGKLLFTVAGTDILAKLEAAKADGTFPYEYGMTTVPDLTDTLKSRSRSITTTVAVNGLSDQREKAHDLAKYITGHEIDTLYSRCGKMPAKKGAKVGIEGEDVFYAEYEDSVPMPKMMVAGNFWIKLEIAFTDIWKGADVNETLKALAENWESETTGESVTKEFIEIPVEEEPEEEYVEETQTQE